MAGPINSDLAPLSKRQIFIGTSSWKYDGWKDLIYKKVYRTKKDFEENCLEEYPYTALGVDHTYYSWPIAKTIEKYTRQTKALLGLKATERVTVYRFPKLPRYGKEGGLENGDFLNPEIFQERFLNPLSDFSDHIGCIMLEFSHFYPGTLPSGREFLKRLEKFIRGLNTPPPIAVEVRNSAWITGDYFRALSDLGLGHVFNSWTRMPSIGEQIKVWGDVSLPFLASRILLTPGRPYEKAVEAFSPYNRIQDEQPTLRKDVANLIERAVSLGIPAYVFVNNRAEGCAPKTIEGILANVTPF